MVYVIFIIGICIVVGLWIQHAKKQESDRQEKEKKLREAAIAEGIKAGNEGREESECPYNDGDGLDPGNSPLGVLALRESWGEPFGGSRFWWLAGYRQGLKERSKSNPKSSNIRSPSAAKEDPWFDETVNKLISIYVAHPNHDSHGLESRQELERIGKMLNERGGMKLMRAVHAEFSRRCAARNVRDTSGHISAPRSLEYSWNGIGAWMS